MRIKEEFKGEGEFWLPSTPETKVPGILLISDGGKIELEITGQIKDATEKFNFNLKRIVGIIQKGRTIPSKPVTLDGCNFKTIPLPFGIPKGLIHVNKVFVGHFYDEDIIPSFNTFTFSIEKLDEWVGISGIKIDPQPNRFIPTISYDQPDDFSLKLANGMKLFIICRASWKYSLANEVAISEKIYLQLVSQNERKYEEFISVARRITEFLCFAMNNTLALDSISATSENLREKIWDNTTRPIPIDIYYSSWPYSKNEPTINWDDFLFGFAGIRDNAEKIINNWLNGYDQSAPAIDLYFLAKMGSQTYLEEKFLTLVQGLEAYHRSRYDEQQWDTAEFKELVNNILELCPNEKKPWLEAKLKSANDINLRKRIIKLIELFPEIIVSKKKCNKLIHKIVKKRNDLTHNGLSSESNITSSDLEYLCQKMELIFELHFLLLIGFSLDKIESIVNNCPGLKQKSNL